MAKKGGYSPVYSPLKMPILDLCTRRQKEGGAERENPLTPQLYGKKNHRYKRNAKKGLGSGPRQ